MEGRGGGDLYVGEVEVEAIGLIPHLLLRNRKAQHGERGRGC